MGVRHVELQPALAQDVSVLGRGHAVAPHGLDRNGYAQHRMDAEALAAQGIFLWSGHNYALEVVRQLGLPEEEGVVRIGMAHYNTEKEIAQALASIKLATGQI